MKHEKLVQQWFGKWESGDFINLPLSDDFTHSSPYGTIKGKSAYLNLIKANREKFLGHRFEIHEELYGKNKACVRYTAIQGNFRQDVSEWYHFSNGLISEIIAYYNIEGDISEDRKLKDPSHYK